MQVNSSFEWVRSIKLAISSKARSIKHLLNRLNVDFSRQKYGLAMCPLLWLIELCAVSPKFAFFVLFCSIASKSFHTLSSHNLGVYFMHCFIFLIFKVCILNTLQPPWGVGCEASTTHLWKLPLRPPWEVHGLWRPEVIVRGLLAREGCLHFLRKNCLF
jgi:hypothetical protein